MSGSSPDGRFWQGDYFRGLTTVAWSLIAEIVYYAMYPAVLLAASKVGFPRVLVISIGTSLAVILFDPHMNFWQYNFISMAIAGLPLWITGCLLAEAGLRDKHGSFELLMWRCLTITYLISSNFILKFTELQMPSPIIYLPFSFVIYQWLSRELTYNKAKSISVLEWAGKGSYSFYMLHKSLMLVHAVYIEPIVGKHWALIILVVFSASSAFAYLVEWPSHRLGYFLARKLSHKKASNLLPLAK
jgi:peptidoglycan/LPS O-acetylase OafA/YrhL